MAFNFPDAPTAGQVFQSYTWDGEKWISTLGGLGLVSSEAAQFLIRASGLDSTYIAAYTELIDGLVADGIWSKFDVLRIYATQNSTTALLNLVSSNYTATVNGSPVFAAGFGFTGVSGSATTYINSNFNPLTAASPKYTQNSAHLSSWSSSTPNLEITSPTLGSLNGSATQSSMIIPYYTSSLPVVFHPNVSSVIGARATAPPYGHILANRSSASQMEGYSFGGNVLSVALASTALISQNFYELGGNVSGTANGSGYELSQTSLGSSLTAPEASNFYNRLKTFFTTTHPMASPAALPGLLGWWDASVTSSLVVFGSDIASIADQSGAGRTLTGAASNSPTYNATGLNSRPTMLFSAGGGRRQRIVRTIFPFGTGNAMTFFCVGYMTSATSASGRMMSYLASPNDYDNNLSALVARDTTNQKVMMMRGGDSRFGANITYGVPFRLIAALRSDGTKFVYINGVSTVSYAQGTAAFGNNGTFSLGACEAATSAGEWDGAIAEAGIVNTYVDQFTAISLDAYLKAKWGL